jgi:hypothetical protein
MPFEMLGDEKQKDIECCACQRSIDYGMEAVQVQNVISGPRGLIPLGEALVFCSEECHESYFNGSASSNGGGTGRIP